jgi:PhnB protein
VRFTPYLNFGGNCREAFTRYQQILGGELSIMTTTDMPEEDRPPGAAPDMTMNAELTFGDQALLGSDDMPERFAGVRGMHTHLTVDNIDDAERIFAALAEGGTVVMPIAETFWSPRFGMCTDRFGIPWMINTEPPAES